MGKFLRGIYGLIRDYDVEDADIDGGFDIRKDNEAAPERVKPKTEGASNNQGSCEKPPGNPHRHNILCLHAFRRHKIEPKKAISQYPPNNQ